MTVGKMMLFAALGITSMILLISDKTKREKEEMNARLANSVKKWKPFPLD